MPTEFVELKNEDVEHLIKIPKYVSSSGEHYFDDLYCDPTERIFFKRFSYNLFTRRRPYKYRQSILVYDTNHKRVHISFHTLIGQYPELKDLYDFTWKPPVCVHRTEDGKIEISMDSSIDSSVIDSWMDEAF